MHLTEIKNSIVIVLSVKRSHLLQITMFMRGLPPLVKY